MLPGFCAEVGIPATAAGFRADLHERLDAQCRATDGAYPDLADGGSGDMMTVKRHVHWHGTAPSAASPLCADFAPIMHIM
jgi:hypothetical protein